jgi:hypothetical protein
MSNFKLTEDQEIAVNLIIDFLKSSNEDILTLAGIGGAGKTTVIKEALHGLNDVIGATVSHSAKGVLKESLGDIAECFTVAQLLGLKQNIDEDGKITFVARARFDRNGIPYPLPIHGARYLIIDECSMIDDETFERIITMKPKECKVVFLGDPYQLPPIDGGKDSICFRHKGAELKIPMRYTGPIADLGLRIRKEIDDINSDTGGSRNFLNNWQVDELKQELRTSQVNEDGSGYIFLNDIEKAVEIASDTFRKAKTANDIRLIAYRNKSIDQVNDVIRANTYNMTEEDLEQFMPGELVICDGGFGDKGEIHNNAIFRVEEYKPITGPRNIASYAMLLNPQPTMKNNREIIVLDWDKGRHDYFDILNPLKIKAQNNGRQWPNYYKFKEQWAWFSYAYCQSSHKSQGRTYEDVIVFENDIMSVKKNSLKAKLQAMYVACTRAKRRVYIYNNKYRVDQSGIPKNVREELGL